MVDQGSIVQPWRHWSTEDKTWEGKEENGKGGTNRGIKGEEEREGDSRSSVPTHLLDCVLIWALVPRRAGCGSAKSTLLEASHKGRDRRVALGDSGNS